MFYFAHTPWLLKKLFPYGVWDIPAIGKEVYLTFDDGPHPTITNFVLKQLHEYNAKATFFCIGKNVNEHPQVYEQIIQQGHRTGNHTQHHLNGWKTNDADYVENISLAQKLIDSNLFRPPYGRIRKKQVALIREKFPDFKIIFWNVLSADFDTHLNASTCINYVLKYTRPGSILVFHDSEKAFPRLEKTLPVVLKELTSRGFLFKAIPHNLS